MLLYSRVCVFVCVQVLGVGILEIFHAVQNSQYNTTTRQEDIVFYTVSRHKLLLFFNHL